VTRLHDALEIARGVDEMDMTEAAWMIWDGLYEALTREIPGLFGLVTAALRPRSGGWPVSMPY